MAWWRRRAVPDAVTAVSLDPGERRVAWALTTSAEPVVATEAGLRLPGVEAITWDRIERASFARPVLTVVESAEVEGKGRRHVVELDLSDETDLPQVLRARVSASVAWSSYESLRPGCGVRVVGRRQRGQEALAWQLVFDPGCDLHDPGLRAQAEQHLLAARRTIG